MFELTVNHQQMEANARHCAEQGVTLPTFAEMRNPDSIPESRTESLKNIGLWDVDPANLFRITWKNEPIPHGGGFGGVNTFELPFQLTGTKARIIGICGKYFPTGAHKVGATFGCFIPELISGNFNPATTKAVWPSTGNYCRGGAYVSKLLGCESVALLPENMSRERFEWLSNIAGEVIKTHGCESNVKEIFDACWELRRTRDDIHIFNQFEQLGNCVWHYEVTGEALAEIIRATQNDGFRYQGFVTSSGSGGTMAAAYKLKELWPTSRLAVAEALQCATILYNGYGDHRIEGIGDKHIPWVHDLKQTDMAIGVDDEYTMRLLRLFNDEQGKNLLREEGVEEAIIDRLPTMGISSIANLLAAIKFAKYYELTENDVVLTVFTDSMELYASRLEELNNSHGTYKTKDSYRDWELLMSAGTNHVQELNYYDRKRIHNLKYFTWIEQQARKVEELNAQWYDHENYWRDHLKRGDIYDEQITAFNAMIAHYQKKG